MCVLQPPQYCTQEIDKCDTFLYLVLLHTRVHTKLPLFFLFILSLHFFQLFSSKPKNMDDTATDVSIVFELVVVYCQPNKSCLLNIGVLSQCFPQQRKLKQQKSKLDQARNEFKGK